MTDTQNKKDEIKDPVGQLLAGTREEEQDEQPVPLGLPEEVLTGSVGGFPERTPSELAAVSERTKFDKEVPTVGEEMTWLLKLDDLGEVLVSDEDREKFIESVMLGKPLTLEIENDVIELPITIESPTLFAQDVVFAALRQDEEDKIITGPTEYGTKAQQYLAAIQLVRIGDVPYVDRVVFDPATGIKEGIKQLRQQTRDTIGNIAGPRWGYILRALRVFELKNNLCLARLSDRSFWKPADSA